MIHSMTMMRAALAGAMLGAWAMASPAAAAAIDPVGDFLPTYAGPHDADLDVTSVFGVHDGSHGVITLGATLAGPVNPASSGFYVFGINRGAGVATFAAIGATNVLFDAVAIVTESGTARVTVAGVTTALDSFTIAGNRVEITIPISLLPSTGFAAADYTINMWPRIGAPFAGNAAISDFAPDNANIRLAAPEPASLALMAIGLAGLGLVRRRG